ncbi:MAG: DUF4918 family protein [Chlorobiales bacterium]|nr:DUF4918 family protein [Chlorobiales bacterium]
MTFGQQAYRFFTNLSFEQNLPDQVEVMNPYMTKEVQRCIKVFFDSYYADSNKRVYIWGINPGRHGGGVTGLPFTDPFALTHYLGIDHALSGQRELSSEFVYQVIEAFGGARKFYAQFYINSLSPLGFQRRGKNYNFYDDHKLCQEVTPFIVESIKQQMAFGAQDRVCISLGTGKLYKFFSDLNGSYKFFREIIPIEHPRFIMQYRRKSLAQYIQKYNEILKGVL